MYLVGHIELTEGRVAIVMDVLLDEVCFILGYGFLWVASQSWMRDLMCSPVAQALFSMSHLQVDVSDRWMRQSFTYWLYVTVHGPRPLSMSSKRRVGSLQRCWRVVSSYRSIVWDGFVLLELTWSLL